MTDTSPLIATSNATSTRVIKNNIKEYSTKVCPLAPTPRIKFHATFERRIKLPHRYCRSLPFPQKAPIALCGLDILLFIG
jgi:hypothetical protein